MPLSHNIDHDFQDVEPKDIENYEIDGVTFKTYETILPSNIERQKLITENPVAAATVFQNMMQTFVEELLGMEVHVGGFKTVKGKHKTTIHVDALIRESVEKCIIFIW